MGGTPQRLSHLSPQLVEYLNRGLLEAMPGGVIYIKVDGTFGAANQAALTLLGMSRDTLTGRIVSDFEPETIHLDGTPCRVEEYPASQALATGEPATPLTIGIRRPDGQVLWAIFEAIPIRGAEGKVEGAIVTFIDVTDRKRAEDEAKRSQALLDRAQTLAQFGGWEWTFESNKVTWTDGMFEIYGTTPEDFGGTLEAVVAAIHPEDRAIVTERFRLVAEGGDGLRTEYRIVRSDGTIRNVWGISETINGSDGQPRFARGTVQDITERKELEHNVHQIQRMESIGQLAGGIAHDFNNLLQVIMSNASLGMHESPDSVEFAQIERAAERASDLTKQLLAFGRRQPFKPTILDPNQLLQDVEQMLVSTLAGNVRLELALGRDVGSINADSAQLERVLVNLCINARDAMPKGGTITLSTRMVRGDAGSRLDRTRATLDRYVQISVADTGIGMTAETQDKIFEPFFSTKKVDGGTGLGLAAVFGIMLQHEGRVEVDSEFGIGTTFRLNLPTVAAGGALPRPTPKPPKGASRAEGKSKTILVVEDNEMVRNVAKRALQRGGYRVLVADDGRAALAMLEAEETEVSLVMTDILMPGMGGVELGAILDKERPETPVLYTTGFAKEQVAGSIRDDRLLTKPYVPAVLLGRIASILESDSD